MKKRQLTISNLKDLRNFVNRSDVSIESAFEVAKTFLNVGNDNDDNYSICWIIRLIGGNEEPDFTKENINNWIDDYDKDPLNCIAMFSFR